MSAYVLVRGREAALVDCGFGSRVEEIGRVLRAAGTGWGRVRHVLITHSHPDHVGGFVDITAAAPRAALYAGKAEMDALLPAVWSGRSQRWPVRPVTDGQEVFGLEVVHTPGHTAGHIAIFDNDSRVLLAGDALNSTIDGLTGPMQEYTPDMRTAEESVRKLAALEPRTILVGHGPPIVRDAAEQLQRLAASSTS